MAVDARGGSGRIGRGHDAAEVVRIEPVLRGGLVGPGSTHIAPLKRGARRVVLGNQVRSVVQQVRRAAPDPRLPEPSAS